MSFALSFHHLRLSALADDYSGAEEAPSFGPRGESLGGVADGDRWEFFYFHSLFLSCVAFTPFLPCVDLTKREFYEFFLSCLLTLSP